MQHYHDDMIHQRYRLTHLLGQGGMASVYLATDIKTPRNIAVKQNSHNTQDDQNLFDAEVNLLSEILSKQSSPKNIPIIFDYFTENNGGKIIQYTVMQYIEGEDLESIINRGVQVEPALAVFWLEQIMLSIEFFHMLKPSIVHRDIKPGNIRVDTTGENVYLVDFGLAGDTKQNYGTPGFAPLEQYHGKSDSRSDIYALGATAYALLLGEDPPNAIDLQMKKAKIFETGKTLDANLKACIEKAMQSEPSNRYQSVSEMRIALRSAISLPADGKIPTPKLPPIVVQTPKPLAPAPIITLTPYQSWLAERNASCMQIVYSASSKNLISGGTKNIRFWPMTQLSKPPATGFDVAQHSDWVSSLALSEKKAVVASAGRDCMIYLFDVRTRRILRSWRSQHSVDIPALAFSSNGQLLASAGRGDKKIFVWNIDRPDEHPSFTINDVAVYGLAFSQDGLWLAAACDDQCFRVWSTKDFKEIPLDDDIKNTNGWLSTIVFRPDGALLAMGGNDGGVHIRQLRNSVTNSLLESDKWFKVDVLGRHQGTIYSVAFSLDGRLLATGGSDRMLYIWDPQHGRLITSFGPFDGVIFSIIFANSSTIVIALDNGSIHPIAIL